MHRPNLVGGVLLIFFGLVFLAGNLGFIDPGYFYRLGQLWPLWFVVGGLLLMSRTFPRLRLAAGVVVALMLATAIVDPAFMDSFSGYRFWHRDWTTHSFWGLLFLAGSVWVLYSLFGRKSQHASE